MDEADRAPFWVLSGQRGRGVRRTARAALGLVALGGCYAFSVEGWSGVAYLLGLHGSLGAGLWPALAALWAILLGIVLPPSLWGAWPALIRSSPRQAWSLGVGACVLLALSGAASFGLARPKLSLGAPARLGDAELEAALSSLARVARRLPRSSGPLSALVGTPPALCENPPEDAARLTVFAVFASRRALGPHSVCAQGATLEAALGVLERALRRTAVRGPVVIDVVSAVQELPRRHAWLDALKLRPGLDGVCDGPRCLMPWQLLERGLFSTYRPVPIIPDFQFGVSPDELRQALAVPSGTRLQGLSRLVTRSYSLDLGSKKPALTPLVRMRRRDVPVTPDALSRATRAAEQYVLSAQLPDGRFRYTLEPTTGVADAQSLNLARQAGTTLALCELGRATDEVRRAIAASLASFRPFERSHGDMRAFTHDPRAPLARLGESALPLVALLSCDGDPTFAPTVAGLSRYVLALQRDNGSFAPGLDLTTGVVESGSEPLYAGGQAVLALLLLERRLRARPDAGMPQLEVVSRAAERAMEYFAHDYWSHPLKDFFYLEENWHCLAARAALGVHRNAGYERFCLDYVRFKARLILEREEGVDPDFDGGFGFGNVVPPHNTGAAGFAEAMAAAIAVRRAQGEQTLGDEALLGRVIGFLLRQQWSEQNCFACASREVIGGMSEHTHSLLTRIDFAQHAWAGLGHGGRVLGLLPAHSD